MTQLSDVTQAQMFTDEVSLWLFVKFYSFLIVLFADFGLLEAN